MTFVLKKVNKSYFNKKIEHKVLKNINLTFPEKGLVFICGKSGSGKTTLLNLLTKIDKQTSGDIFYKGTKINKLNEKETCVFRNKEIGIVFQSFNLIDDKNSLENILMPRNIFKKKEEINLKVDDLLKKVGLEKEVLFKDVKDLSGGEKQRIAIVRALINDPQVILADEPTGSLDSKNSISVLKILKKISKDRLVIIVSHNLELVQNFKDYVIELEDGKVVKNDMPKAKDVNDKIPSKVKEKFDNAWTYKSGLNKIKRQKSKNFLSAISIVISCLATILITGFVIGSKDSSKLEGRKQLDYAVMSVAQETQNTSTSLLNVVKQRRPTFEEFEYLSNEFENTIFDYDLSFFLNNGAKLFCDEKEINQRTFQPIYNFEKGYINRSLILKGEAPKFYDFSEVLINESFYTSLKNKGIEEPLESILNLTIKTKIDAKLQDLTEFSGYFEYENKLVIKGVVKDFNFLSTPKIYYSYQYFKDELKNVSINNDLFESAYDFIENVSPLDPVSSYKGVAFSKINLDENYYLKLLDHNNHSLRFTSDPHIRINSFTDLLDAASIGLSLFIIIAILGCVLIIGILAFSTYSEDKKSIAILYSLGASKEQILNIYLTSNLIITLLSALLAILLSPIVGFALNLLLENIIGIPNLIANFFTPFSIDKIFIIFIVLFVTLIVGFLSVAIPLTYGSGLNLSKELKND